MSDAATERLTGDHVSTLNPNTVDVEPFVHGVTRTEPIVSTGELSVRILATAAQTGSSVGMLEATYSPGGGFPMHIHHKEDEILFLLEGRIIFDAGGEQFQLGPGDVFFGPRGVPHGFVAAGDIPARFIEFFLPGGLEEVFRSPDELKGYILAGHTGERYDLEIVGGLPVEGSPPAGASREAGIRA
jgi:quercetin dioxygenase-like cupin family protein